MVSFKLGILFTKHDAIEIADPNHEYAGRVSYIDYVISHAHHRVSVTQWWNIGGAESVGLRFDSSWGLRIFSLSHTRDKTKNIFLHFFTDLKTSIFLILIAIL